MAYTYLPVTRMYDYLNKQKEDTRTGTTPPNKVGDVVGGKMWNGKAWVPVQQTPRPTMADLKNFENANPQLIPKPDEGSGETTYGGSPVASPMAYQAPAKMSGAELAAMYGITQNRGDIEKVLNEATAAKFNELDAGTRKLRDQQLTDYASQFDQYQDYARQNRASAMKTGLNRGSAVAQDIMSQVNAQRGGAENQTFYQQGLADIVNQRGTQLGADKFNAMNMSNEIGMGLGNLGANFYQSDTAGLTGYQQYLASLANANAMQAQASSSRYAADKGYDATMNDPLMKMVMSLNIPTQMKIDVSAGKMTATEAILLYQAEQDKAKLTPAPKSGALPGGAG